MGVAYRESLLDRTGQESGRHGLPILGDVSVCWMNCLAVVKEHPDIANALVRARISVLAVSRHWQAALA